MEYIIIIAGIRGRRSEHEVSLSRISCTKEILVNQDITKRPNLLARNSGEISRTGSDFTEGKSAYDVIVLKLDEAKTRLQLPKYLSHLYVILQTRNLR